MKNNIGKIGIVGFGEIGQSLHKLYSDFTDQIFVKDLNRNDGLEGCEVINISIPYSDNFEEIVCSYIENLNPKLTIINSTVIPGTTKKIQEKMPECKIVHSPVRGVHPNLYEGLKTFVKFVGSEDSESLSLAEKHYRDIEIQTEIVRSSTATELGKILSTTYYGLCIAWHGEVEKMCNEFSCSFDVVSTRFNETYNEGYSKLGKANVIRPVLYAPGSSIGGHCVVPNAELIDKFFNSEAIDLILKYKK